jgi:integrase
MVKAAATNTEYPGVEVRGNSIRVFLMFKRARHSHTLRLEPTRNNIKHAVSLRSAALFALRNGSYNEAEFFPYSLAAASVVTGKRVGESRIDRVRVLLSPKTQARKKVVNDYFVPSAWNTKWINLVRRAEIRHRPPYQTRHTFNE